MLRAFASACLATFALVAHVSAAAPLTKTSAKSFDLYDEVADYVRKLVETDKAVAAQWNAQAAGARQRTGRVSTGPWVPIQWLVVNFEQNVRTGKDAEYVYLAKQALREAQVDGYVVEDNVVARIKVKLHEDLKENPAKPDDFVTAKAELTMEFDGFVRVKFNPVGANLSRPPVTKTFTKDYNIFEEASSLVGRLVESDPKIKSQWEAISAEARENAGGKFQTGPWISTQWQIPSYEATATDRNVDQVFIVRQALREGMRGGYTVGTNAVTRVRAKSKDKLQPPADGKGEPTVVKGELTLTFEGFVQADIADGAAPVTALSPAAPSRPAAPSAPSAPVAPPKAPATPAAPAGPAVTAKFLHSTPGTYGWWTGTPSLKDPSYDFFPNGNLHIQGPDGEATMWEGKWSLKGDQLTLTNKPLKTSKTVTAAISGQDLLLNGVRYRRYKPE